jgi:hypothetical protein
MLFLSFEGAVTRIELMTTTKLLPGEKDLGFTLGLAHFAMEVNDR